MPANLNCRKQSKQNIVDKKPTKMTRAWATTMRNPNWSLRDDETLYKAWLRLLEDGATGTDQQRSTPWGCIMKKFVSIAKFGNNRNANSLMNRWFDVQGHINKYYVQIVKKTSISEFNSKDLVTKNLLSHNLFIKISKLTLNRVFAMSYLQAAAAERLYVEKRSSIQMEGMLVIATGYFEMV